VRTLNVRKLALPWASAVVAALLLSVLIPSSASAAFGDASLGRGDAGRDVRVLQRWLTLVGFSTRVDGRFGGRTVRAVRGYERRHGLRVDGRVSRAQARGLRRRAYAARASWSAPAPAPAAAPAVAPGERAGLSSDGRTALAPASAPAPVKAAIAAANRLVRKPYRYGGGHGRFEDSGYDCSGAVSYALHGAGVLDSPLDSSGLARFGAAGPGTWITIYGHGSHAYAVIAGLRFDTSGSGESGPRWRRDARSPRGYAVRHPAGL
jgi:peptidoglycan hydrolase-like protein with peptidoglycan-binding domain